MREPNPQTQKEKSIRSLEKQTSGTTATEAEGIEITRLIGSGDFDMIDPFLLMDIFKSTPNEQRGGGFPDHPHRGFETITYLLKGRLNHKDNAGHTGTLEAGDVQWMTAGSGIIHSEMPDTEKGQVHGIQFWLNLPQDEKMRTPEYQDITNSDLRELPTAEYRVKIILGEMNKKIITPLTSRKTEPLILAVELFEKGSYHQQIPIAHNAFIYSIDGNLEIGGERKSLPAKTLGLLSKGDYIEVRAPTKAQFLLVAGKPLDEPVARGGPFVMNTKEEILQAFKDYQSGQF